MFPFLEKIIQIANNLLNFLLKFSILISSFFIIYLGIKTYFSSKNFNEIKLAFLYILLGLALLGLIFLNKEIIIQTIKTFVPTFK